MNLNFLRLTIVTLTTAMLYLCERKVRVDVSWVKWLRTPYIL